MTGILCNLKKFIGGKALIVLYSTNVDHACQQKLGKVVNVAIIGAPNAGKSTLINSIVERKICAASNKVHTTTNMARAFCFHEDTQIVFLDTPGIITPREKKKYNLPDSMMNACHRGIRCANVIGVIHDVSNRCTKDNLHKDVLKILNEVENIPSFLILNKIDQLKSKHQLLTLIRNLTNGLIAGKPTPDMKKLKGENRGYSKFSDVFLVSALNGDGVSDIKQYLLKNAKPAGFQFPPEAWTDQKKETLIVEATRAKFLDFLSQEIPYNLDIHLELFEEVEDDDRILCSVTVECPSERLVKLIAGSGGGRLQQIKFSLANDLTDLFQKPASIYIHLKEKNKPTHLD